jgi:hypothetical protein
MLFNGLNVWKDGYIYGCYDDWINLNQLRYLEINNQNHGLVLKIILNLSLSKINNVNVSITWTNG